MYPINSIFGVDVLLNKYYNMRKLESFGKNSVGLACDCPLAFVSIYHVGMSILGCNAVYPYSLWSL